MLALEIQEGKFPMREKEHCARLGATAACTTCLMELVAGCGQSKLEAEAKLDIGLGDSWFASVTAIVKAARNGQELIGGVKTNSSKSPKKEMEAFASFKWKRTHEPYILSKSFKEIMSAAYALEKFLKESEASKE